jgi:hypothetical protein
MSLRTQLSLIWFNLRWNKPYKELLLVVKLLETHRPLTQPWSWNVLSRSLIIGIKGPRPRLGWQEGFRQQA